MNIPSAFSGRLTRTSWICGYRDGFYNVPDRSHLRTPKSEAEAAYKAGYAYGQQRREKREQNAKRKESQQ